MSALEKGDRVLITGGTGWIGSHVVFEALAAGLLVRLAIRNEQKAKVLVNALEDIYGKKDRLVELITVPDFSQDGAYDQAVIGVHGIIHVASNMSFNSDPDKVITPVLKGISSLLKASQRQKSIRRFILTSSSLALGSPNPGGKVTQHFDSTLWNDKSVEFMKQSPNPLNVYASSKVLSEKYAWNFIKTENPQFILNTIIPNANLGAGVPGVLPLLTTGKWIPELAETGYCWALDIGSQYHIDVFDCAKLHIKAAMVQDVQNERILAFGTRYSVNNLIDAVKSVRPDAPIPQRKDEWDMLDNTSVDVKRANQLLENQGGLRDLEYSVRASLQGL